MALRATLHTIRAISALDLSATAPPLVAPFIAAGSVTLLFGPPSAGKSMVTATLAKAIASGTSLWDVFPCTKARVLIVQADMNSALYQERLQASAANMPDDILVMLTDGMPFDVCKIGVADPIICLVREFAPHIIFVDTLRKTHAFDEIDNTAPDRVYAAWRMLFPHAAFVFLHHSRKVSTQATTQDTITREAFRGSGAWAASADTLLMLRRVRRANNPDWMTRLLFVRTRSCEEPAPILLKLTNELLLEPVAETTLERSLLAWIAVHPRGSRKDAVHWLTSTGGEDNKPLCTQSTAYRTWDRIVKGEVYG